MKKLGVIYLNEQSMEVCGGDARVFGTCGMPGIGKTTVAKVVYKINPSSLARSFSFRYLRKCQIEYSWACKNS